MTSNRQLKKVRKEIKKDIKKEMPVYFKELTKCLGFWKRCKLGLCIVFKKEF